MLPCCVGTFPDPMMISVQAAAAELSQGKRAHTLLKNKLQRKGPPSTTFAR